jgi:CheY-like chemotaxis protein
MSPDARIRVLVVDDHEDAAEMLRAVMLAYGYDVAVARDGPSAIALTSTFHPHVALVDIGLPKMNGFELAHRLRGLPLPTPLRLVALTGYGGAADRQRAFDAGFESYLLKPVDLGQLRRVVDRLDDVRGPVSDEA